MLPDNILEKIFANPRVQKMSCTMQSDLIDIVEQTFLEIKEEQPYATVSDILSPDE